MTVFAYDEARGVLISTWDTGVGCVASTLADLPKSAERDAAIGLAFCLTGLSRQVWRTYTHPASAADSLEPNTEGWRRQGEREAFAEVVTSLRNPNLPHGDHIVQSYILVEEAAHRVGRALHVLADQALTDRVVAEVEDELAAVEQAERGDLTGRAKQAVLLTRADVSPVQVSAANDLLRQHPLGSTGLLQDVDPTAAAVAAAHWLQAAAEVASEAADCHPTQVVLEADNIEALAVETPTLVLERLDAGETPRGVVTDLIKTAMTAAEGRLADPDALVHQIEEAKQKAQRFGPGDEELLAGLMPRVTPLDPMRPAHDLLEDLLDGIRGSWLLYRECAEYDDDDLEDFTDDEPEDNDEDLDDHIDTAFFEAVRTEATEHQGQLL
ncbi:hypothetical protein [Amycolatopsis vastitatis]|uniref:hypothetical protein n=1 Tax=Amycolatopsis vastitatis TaxID=1905142 RepID=UPI001F0ACEA4|nr:hypothetical protein [Amycolatopsis vastitatis]